MADVSALYPQPQAASATAPGLMSGSPTNLLGSLGQINQLALFQKEFQAKQALGEAWGNALNPDGTVDKGKLTGSLKNDPRASFLLPEATGTMLDQRNKQIANDTNQFALYGKQTDFVQQWLARRANEPNVGPDQIYSDAAAIARNSQIPAPVINSMVSSVLSDPKGIHVGLQNLQNRVMGAGAAAGRVAAPPGPGAIPQTQPLGAAGYGEGGHQPMAGSMPGTTAVGVSPAQSAALGATGTQSGTQLAQDRIGAANYRREVFPLEQAIPALEGLGTTGTGPGTETLNQFKSFLQSAGGGAMLGVDLDKIKNFDEAKKYLTDWVMANGSTGTNDKLAAAFASNANVGISNAAAVDVAKSALALRRMKQAQTIEFAKSGLPESEYTNWASTWNVAQDPRAFGVDLMTPKAKSALLADLNKKGHEGDKARFIASLRAADSNGLSSPRGGWNAPAQ